MSDSIGGVDASIPLQAGKGVPQINPLATVGQYVQTANGLNQLRAFPGELQLQQQAIQGGALGLSQKKLAAAAQFLTPHLNEPVTHSSVTSMLANAQNAGIDVSPIVSALNNAPSGDGPEFQQAFRNIIGAGAQTGNGQQQLNAVRGVPGTIDQGDQVQGVLFGPQLGASPGAIVPQGAGIAVGRPSASQLIQPVPTTPGPLGEPRSTTLGNSVTMQGIYTKTGQPFPQPAFQRIPPALRGPGAASASPAAEGAPASAEPQVAGQPNVVAPITMGLGPGQQSAAASGGAQSSGAYQAISDAGVKANAQRSLLQNMRADAQSVPIGPGTVPIRQMQALTQTMMPKLAQAFGIDPKSLAAGEDLDKIANQLADAQGAGSDARLAVNQGANPSNHNTPAGLSLILAKLQGNADYLSARQQLAARYQAANDPTGANVRQFEAQIGSKLDPRVFQFNAMDPAQRTQYFAEMKSQAERDAFKKAYLTIQHMDILPGATSQGGQ